MISVDSEEAKAFDVGGGFRNKNSVEKDYDFSGTLAERYDQYVRFSSILSRLDALVMLPCIGSVRILVKPSTYEATGRITLLDESLLPVTRKSIEEMEAMLQSFCDVYHNSSFSILFSQQIRKPSPEEEGGIS
jgi:hypothetical protein